MMSAHHRRIRLLDERPQRNTAAAAGVGLLRVVKSKRLTRSQAVPAEGASRPARSKPIRVQSHLLGAWQSRLLIAGPSPRCLAAWRARIRQGREQQRASPRGSIVFQCFFRKVCNRPTGICHHAGRLACAGVTLGRLRLAGSVRLLATRRRAIERIAPGRSKRSAAKCVGANLYPVMAPKVPHVTILAKAAGVYARLSAFDAKAPALAITDKRGRFANPLSICDGRTLAIHDSRSGTPLMGGRAYSAGRSRAAAVRDVDRWGCTVPRIKCARRKSPIRFTPIKRDEISGSQHRISPSPFKARL
jgi:hypothetical protein